VRAELAVGDAPLVVGVGRLHPQKGWDILVAALALLRSQVPAVRAVIAGEGPRADALAEQVRALGLDRTLGLVGPDPDAAALLAAADVVVVPSVWESGPLVLAEAMWLGRPVVSTPVGFAPELLGDGEAGRLVPAGDPVSLACAVEAVLEDPAAARSMGEAGRRRVSALLDRDRLIDDVAGVYRRVRPARCA
jgi:glycosyltransferase involved in cell wall biosynthesis